MQGHTKPVLALAAHPTHTALLLSSSLDGTVRLWNCSAPMRPTTAPLLTISTTALALVSLHLALFNISRRLRIYGRLWQSFTPDGQSFVTGGHGGVLKQWSLPEELLSIPLPRPPCFPQEFTLPHKIFSKQHKADIGRQRLLPSILSGCTTLLCTYFYLIFVCIQIA